ncbi:uncharacterized protein C8R40DRAFT_1171493 [Lentinula edodes]|uniref:uncharacterized protein n=1 Tax=Lentinula edodes TaxID=5353 RepID=UPI001E8D9B2C|nr:uncharacterized protein C8R40DRAFT_1171493 [Lentinula edodes]KAH7874383.1 hypothetical protein C8R40DRAFT_1171493 [Lentinula edodes]
MSATISNVNKIPMHDSSTWIYVGQYWSSGSELIHRLLAGENVAALSQEPMEGTTAIVLIMIICINLHESTSLSISNILALSKPDTSPRYVVSKHNWWLTGPIAFLSVARVGLAFTTTAEMMITKTFPEFATKFRILFTSGLFVSAVTDVVVSVARYYYLRNLKQGYLPTQEVVDAVVVFTINDGFLTCAVVIASIACECRIISFTWAYILPYLSVSPFNALQFGHWTNVGPMFAVYSNSVLATLNLRNWYRHQYTWNRPLGLSMIRATTSDGSRVHAHERANTMLASSGGSPNKHAHARSIDDGRVEVYVEHQVEYNVGELIPEDLDALETHSHKSGEIPSTTGLRL